MTESDTTIALLHDLARRPGHDEVKADFRQLLVESFGVAQDALEFERRVPEVRGRLDALIGRTIFEAKSDLDREWADVERRMPDYLADREREEGERFVGVASDGRKWAVFELNDGALTVVRRTELDPDRAESVKFQRARGLIRTALTEAGIAKAIDALVNRLLDPA